MSVISPLHCVQEFVPDSEDTEHASVCSPEKVEIVCRLLGLEHPEDIAFALTTLRNFTRGEYARSGVIEYSVVHLLFLVKERPLTSTTLVRRLLR